MNPLLYLGLMLLNNTLTDFRSCVQVFGECNNITYYLYTKNTADSPYEIKSENVSSYEAAPFVKERPVIFLMHGYEGHKDYSPNVELRPAFFKNGEYNIVTVDYEPLVQEGCYVMAAYNVDIIGMCIAKFIQKLMEIRTEINKNDLNVIGFSLGAQITGSIGKYYSFYTHDNLPRITALDPALPFFDSYLTPNPFRIDESDADFVQIIHTNVRNKGILDPAGHVDFYINGGSNQPGCFGNASCDHVRAVEIYAESINSEMGFWGVPCKTISYNFVSLNDKDACEPTSDTFMGAQLLGEKIDTTARGTYKVVTSKKPPFALGRPEA